MKKQTVAVAMPVSSYSVAGTGQEELCQFLTRIQQSPYAELITLSIAKGTYRWRLVYTAPEPI